MAGSQAKVILSSPQKVRKKFSSHHLAPTLAITRPPVFAGLQCISTTAIKHRIVRPVLRHLDLRHLDLLDAGGPGSFRGLQSSEVVNESELVCTRAPAAQIVGRPAKVIAPTFDARLEDLGVGVVTPEVLVNGALMPR
jgi:hypothetical protein